MESSSEVAGYDPYSDPDMLRAVRLYEAILQALEVLPYYQRLPDPGADLPGRYVECALTETLELRKLLYDARGIEATPWRKTPHVAHNALDDAQHESDDEMFESLLESPPRGNDASGAASQLRLLAEWVYFGMLFGRPDTPPPGSVEPDWRELEERLVRMVEAVCRVYRALAVVECCTEELSVVLSQCLDEVKFRVIHLRAEMIFDENVADALAQQHQSAVTFFGDTASFAALVAWRLGIQLIYDFRQCRRELEDDDPDEVDETPDEASGNGTYSLHFLDLAVGDRQAFGIAIGSNFPMYLYDGASPGIPLPEWATSQERDRLLDNCDEGGGYLIEAHSPEKIREHWSELRSTIRSAPPELGLLKLIDVIKWEFANVRRSVDDRHPAAKYVRMPEPVDLGFQGIPAASADVNRPNGPDDALENTFWWDNVPIYGFKPTEWDVLLLLWKHRDERWLVTALESEMEVAFGWKYLNARTNFQRHQTEIWKCFQLAGFEKPFGLDRGKTTIVWHVPTRSKSESPKKSASAKNKGRPRKRRKKDAGSP